MLVGPYEQPVASRIRWATSARARRTPAVFSGSVSGSRRTVIPSPLGESWMKNFWVCPRSTTRVSIRAARDSRSRKKRSTLTTQSPSRTTKGSKCRWQSSMLTRPSRTTCGNGRSRGSGQLVQDEAEHLVGVLPDLDPRVNLADGPLFVNHEGRPMDPFELPAHEVLGAEHAVGL